MEIKIGRVVFDERGYRVAEVHVGPPDGSNVIGFSLIGPNASESIIYASRLQALEALHDIEERLSES